ncbi:MAG: DUF982 domain-containing protein [Shinella sp.]|jgi:hypothetical protein|nr:DUF982 domain-containing protein [Shinella sp.]
MKNGLWNKPITYEENDRGGYRTIGSTEEAARVLLTKWPVKEGKAYLRAQKVCLDVMEGKRKPEEARRAFLKAAEEAGVFVREWRV